ncbi:fungal-specific transcription factor domain-containing protein [Apiosordaria backusii]|uniref:Fungal-specific transcription factor domain-containing protein n=1 Tax=Apiosordaria backusii TaxID=314023 RepID=A0AA40K0R2_9PEZI|nr:fungal-specific transcription factor domain-containing protein [Apiosordaria backusii]
MPAKHFNAGPNITVPFPFPRLSNTTAQYPLDSSASLLPNTSPIAMDVTLPPPSPPIHASPDYILNNPPCSVMNWETTHACFVSRSWQIRSNAMFAATCLGTVLLCFALEFFRRLSRSYDRAIFSRRRQRGDDREEDFNLTVWEQSVRAGIKLLEAALGMVLVLLVVSFNGLNVHEMTSRTRSSEGCWTCRLRRKKCDETRPVCEGCSTLGIDCLYSEQKPEWMDGGERQREKGEWVKQEVKRVAAQRRERRYMRDLESGLGGIGLDMRTDIRGGGGEINVITTASRRELADIGTVWDNGEGIPPDRSVSADTGMEMDGTPTGSAATTGSTTGTGCTTTAMATPCCSSSASSPPDIPNDQQTAVNTPPLPASDGLDDDDLTGLPAPERDAHRTMFYLDYVFPFLFPFYRPTLLDFGRGWLLVLLQRNQALFHVAQTMAGYFYGIILSSDDNKDDVPELCKSHNLAAIQRQQELGLRWLRREIQNVVEKGVRGHLKEASEVVACIVQLLTSEVAVGNSGNWRVHLEAAGGLWEEMWRFHGMGKVGVAEGEEIEVPCFMMLLLQLGSNPLTWTPRGQPWGANQATLRFFSVQLLFLDVLASTALEQPPRLQKWHGHLLETLDEKAMREMMPALVREKEMEVPHLKLVEFIGLENWVVVAIGEIAALDAYKKEMKRTSALSVTQLVARAAVIENRIRAGLGSLGEPEVKHGCSSTGCVPADHPLLHFTTQGMLSPQTMHSTALHARIWAQAALTYLQVVVSGWQPASQEIRHSVTETMNLMLYCLPAPDCLRALVWPFTVTGCLAAPEQEQIFRDMAGAMGPLRAFGTIKEGLTIMEHVWANRAQIEQNADQWDLVACLRCLGQPSLLI